MKERINIYVPDKFAFRKLVKEVKNLWYKQYGESLKIGNILIKSLTYFKNSLENNNTDVNKRQGVHKYGRVRISSW